jgi:hypothetical protein
MRPEGIPAALCKRRQWVAWRFHWDGQRWKKPPINPATGKPAKANDAETWGTFDEALRFHRGGKGDGIGYMLSADDPFVAVDLDDCHDADTGRTDDFAERVIALLGSYAEVSPSGAGLHVFIRGELSRSVKKGFAEVYARGQYITMTGHRLSGCPAKVNRRQPALRTLLEWLDCKRPLPKAESTAQQRTAGGRGPGRYRGLDDDDLIALVCQEKKKFNLYWHGQLAGKPSKSEARLGLLAYLAFYTDCDAERMDRLIRRSGLYCPKWEEPLGDSTLGQWDIEKAISTFKHFGREGKGSTASGQRKRPNAGHTTQSTQHTRVYIVSGADPATDDPPASCSASAAATNGQGLLARLYAEALAVEPPPEADKYSRPTDEPLLRLVALCYRLSLWWAPEPFPLPCRQAGGLLGLGRVQAAQMLKRLVADGILAVAFMPRPGVLGRAAEYRYISQATVDDGTERKGEAVRLLKAAASCRSAPRRGRRTARGRDADDA